MSRIRDWLVSLNLDQHADLFEASAIEWDHLRDLDHETLKEIGVDLVGHRLTILRAISEIEGNARTPPSRGTSAPANFTAKPSSSVSERRQLTVMFCDLVGSTALAAAMDPEDYGEILAAYREAASNAIHRYEGNIANFLGDGLLVYFGYPQAHEDDAERSVRAAFDIVNAIAQLQPRHDVQLQVRIGIATGLVVAGDVLVQGASEERAVLGDTPNLAARLQEAAGPNEILLSESTRRLIEGRFILQPLEPQPLKGIAGLVRAHRAVDVDDAGHLRRSEARPSKGLAGRANELATLEERWTRTENSDGQLVVVTGEAGIGKSRLVQEFQNRVEARASAVVRYQCSPYHTGSAFHPFITQLSHAAGVRRPDSVEHQREKIRRYLRRSLPDSETAAQHLVALAFPAAKAEAVSTMTPQRQRAETIELLVRRIVNMTDQGPVLIVFEDAHWIDPSSRQVLDHLIDWLADHKLLCLITYRPGSDGHWSSMDGATCISLKNLEPVEVSAVIEGVTGGKSLPDAVRAEIIAKTDGIPLFVEELTKTVIEAGFLEESDGRYLLDGPLPPLAIPETLQDSLVARLDRLGSVKEVAQIAACIGRAFSVELLADLCPLDRSALDDALAKLVDAELVSLSGSEHQTIYIFKHALVQDAAYASVLMSKRRRVHASIAAILIERFSNTTRTEPERIAQHYEAAGMAVAAISYWVIAGRQELERCNLSEAETHLTQALALTDNIDNLDQRSEQELEIRTALGAATMALYGWPASQVSDVIKPACDLFEKGHGGPQAFVNLWNLWLHYGCRADHSEGVRVVDRMVQYADEHSDPVLHLIASFAAAMAYLWVGDYEKAAGYEKDALDAYDDERDKSLAWRYNHDPKTALWSWAAHRTWALGFPDQARKLSDAAVAHARIIGHPFNLCWTLGNSCNACVFRGDFDIVGSRIDELRYIAREQELTFLGTYMGSVLSALLAHEKGDYEAAYREGKRAEETWRSIGGRFFSPVIKAAMAHACLKLDRSDQAQDLAEQMVQEMEATGELMMAPEIYRTAALVHLETDESNGRAICLFDKSLALSRQQGTRSLELRTSISMAEYLVARSNKREALELLRPIHASFSEGHDTMDLKRARKILSKMSE
jgi:class 3 adenylate cyclase/tetratricopeptide (TPR) repeat protein/ABC-type transport system involved in cytochrome c biogenesis ATPase subunit